MFSEKVTRNKVTEWMIEPSWWRHWSTSFIKEYSESKFQLHTTSDNLYTEQVNAICVCADVPDLKFTSVKMSVSESTVGYISGAL